MSDTLGIDAVMAEVDVIEGAAATDETSVEADSPELLDEVRGILDRLDTGGPSIESALQTLEQEHGNAAYSELIHVMSHLRFPPDEARQHWEQILQHRENMQGCLGNAVDLRVALISYFLEVNRKLQNPKIIEMQLYERTRESAHRDCLTGLYNYRAFREHLAREVYRTERTASPLTLIMLDVDDFKCFNDNNGHEAGNQALARIAGLLSGLLRKGDIAARYGGEEFALLLTATPKAEGNQVAERIREGVERHCFSGEILTVSLGVATFPADAPDGSELIRRADRALYVSKATGKNQSTLYGRSRRSHGRVDVELTGQCRAVSSEPHALTTLNISEAGVLFETDQRLPIDSFLEVRLNLTGSQAVLAARVVHVAATEDRYFTAARFVDGSSVDRVLLSRFIRERLSAD